MHASSSFPFLCFLQNWKTGRQRCCGQTERREILKWSASVYQGRTRNDLEEDETRSPVWIFSKLWMQIERSFRPKVADMEGKYPRARFLCWAHICPRVMLERRPFLVFPLPQHADNGLLVVCVCFVGDFPCKVSHHDTFTCADFWSLPPRCEGKCVYLSVVEMSGRRATKVFSPQLSSFSSHCAGATPAGAITFWSCGFVTVGLFLWKRKHFSSSGLGRVLVCNKFLCNCSAVGQRKSNSPTWATQSGGVTTCHDGRSSSSWINHQLSSEQSLHNLSLQLINCRSWN